MKTKLPLIIFSFIFILTTSVFSQSNKYNWLPQDSWSIGFGGIYPRYISTTLEIEEGLQNFGGYISIQRNFSEHVGLRFRGSYQHLEGHLNNAANTGILNRVFGLDFDLLYYLAPTSPVSPYFGIGIGGFNQNRVNSHVSKLNGNQLDYQINFNFGSEWKISYDWRIKTELGFHNTVSSSFDGANKTLGGGILGGVNDTYMSFDMGLLYYFSKGPLSKLNDAYNGLEADVDYAKIESMIRKYATDPTEVDYDRIEDIIKKYQSKNVAKDNWVLLGVNFDFNKSTLQSSSYPILLNATQILLTHPELRVEVQGYTDNVGSEKYNRRLSQKRANEVREFLIAKGVDSNRLDAVGYGSSKPVLSNKTASGRAFNRRIEFKIK